MNLLNIINGRRKGVLPAIARWVLYPASVVYGAFASFYHFLYDSGILPGRGLPVPVISVGNITAGGTGKTPMVEHLARRFSTGRKAVILSRGYGRMSRGIQIVSDGRNLLLSPHQSGDEPFLLAGRLPQTAVVVGKDRALAGKYAIRELGAELLILDDGYQHRSLKRDLDIVTINARAPFGYGHFLPRGLLRESERNLRRADIFVLTRVDGLGKERLDSIKSRLRLINPQAPVVESIHCPRHLKRLGSSECRPLSMIKGQDIAALSSVVDYQSFEGILTGLGANIRRAFRYTDHFWYRDADIGEISSLAASANASLIITTEKDAVRLPANRNWAMPVFALIIELSLGAGEEVLEEYLKKI